MTSFQFQKYKLGRMIHDQINNWLDAVDCLTEGFITIREEYSHRYFPGVESPYTLLYQAMDEVEAWIKNHHVTRYQLERNYTTSSWTLRKVPKS